MSQQNDEACLQSSGINNEIPENVAQFQSQLSSQSLEIINQIFPQKILELSRLLNVHTNLRVASQSVDYDESSISRNSSFSIYSYVDIPAPDPIVGEGSDNSFSRKRPRNDTDGEGLDADDKKIDENVEENPWYSVVENDQPPLNLDGKDYHCIKELQKILEDEISCLIEYCCILRAWILFKYPRIDTEENLKVSAIEEMAAELSRVEDSSFVFLNNITRFYVARVKLIKKIHKHPTIQDNLNALIHFDHQHLIDVRYQLRDTCNTYAIIHDMLKKNMYHLEG
ncbi:7755_t:CDS:2 [Acaulospora morrowiae]|uniref:7755_t:CDS:1 n=1 Tax=Acaulospora morrowiae TaxID=94023 RepID=A0A9N9FCE1_9GLOM|nr:7755_t:CDS:2 [Acaulospora morrowiae]